MKTYEKVKKCMMSPPTPGVAPSRAGKQLGLSQWLTRKGLGEHTKNIGLLSKIGKVMMAAYRKKYGAKAKPEMRSQQFAGGGFHDVNIYYTEDFDDFEVAIRGTLPA